MESKTPSLIGPKIVRCHDWRVPCFCHWCPACGHLHAFAVEQPFPNEKRSRWSFNGDGAAPTFSPSMNISSGPYPDGRVERCHYFLKDGQIQFLNDCTHALKGQTVPCPDIPTQQLLRMGLAE